MATTPKALERDREIERLRAELAAARAALADFTYVVTHDLRAPLRHIISYAGMLQEEMGVQDGTEAARFLATITDSAQLMGRQIDGLREWMQLDQIELQPATLDANLLVSELRRALEDSEGEGQGHVVQWQVEPDLPWLKGDAALLKALFAHLLANALKFTRQRKMALIVVEGEMGGGPGAETATIHVRDNGAGFDPAQADKLFNVFQRLHSASQFEGLGLGLALAQKIAQRHGGSIRIDAMLDAGCHVSVTLPTPGRQGELI